MIVRYTMTFNNPDFIIKEDNRLDDGMEYILRRYKGNGGVVEIPEGVTQIENNIFGDDIEPNKTVTKIIMPNSVTDIEMNAFSYCEKLTEISFSKNLKRLCLDLRGCFSIKEIVIPDSVTAICYLHREKNLTDIYVGSNLIEVDDSAFSFISDENDESEADESTYNEIVQKDRIYTIGLLMQNPTYRIIDGFMVNKNTKTALFRTDFTKSELRIPDNVETIGSHCIAESCLFCKKDSFLKKLIISSSVRKINSFAFSECDELESVIYEGLTKDLTIAEDAFDNCALFRKNGCDIICKDSKETIQAKRRTTNSMIRRLKLINLLVKRGEYPNTDDLLDYCRRRLEDPQLSKTTITRSIAFLQDEFGAPLEYDRTHNGYHYTDDNYVLDFETIYGK